MEASTSNGSDDVKTFRGRTLEELLPQIRAELGPDAIVLRRREGRDKKAGGFFQRPFVEVDARAPHAGERSLEIRSDRATAEGLSSPAVQALFEQATPFADALAAAARDSRMEDDTFSASFGPDTTGFSALPSESEAPAPPRRMRDAAPADPSPPASAGLYGPQPNASAIEGAAPAPAAPEPEAVTPPPAPPVADEPPLPEPPVAPAAESAPTAPESAPAAAESAPAAPESAPAAAEPAPVAPAPAAPPADAVDAAEGLDIPAAPVSPVVARPSGIPRPPSADAAEERLVAAGISAALAADVVGEAVTHALPFSAPRNMKRLVRTAFARRFPASPQLGPGARTVAIVGGGGSGKSSAVAHLASTYAAAGAEVAVIELRGNGALAHRLQPLGIGVISAADAEQALERLGAREPLITLIDTPAMGPSAKAADVQALAADLKALGAEVHMALPATISAAAAGEVAAALAPLSPSHVALTHTDETARPGAPVELALTTGHPLSYVCSREGASPADPGALAAQLLP
jgi:flagellar biosynthesis GTPase FlhF